MSLVSTYKLPPSELDCGVVEALLMGATNIARITSDNNDIGNSKRRLTSINRGQHSASHGLQTPATKGSLVWDRLARNDVSTARHLCNHLIVHSTASTR